MNSRVGLGWPDFTILNWSCLNSGKFGKWGSLQNQHLPISSLQNHDTNPTRSLESCKIRAPRILLGSHFFHKLTPTKSQTGPPAHIGYFKKSRPQGCTGSVLTQLCPLLNQNKKGPQWPLQNHSPHCLLQVPRIKKMPYGSTPVPWFYRGYWTGDCNVIDGATLRCDQVYRNHWRY